MPISKQWSSYKNQTLPNQLGVYELAYNKKTVYIGSGNIANRIANHDAKGWNITNVRYEVTNSKRRARQRERAEQRQYRRKNNRLPKYNKRIG